MPACKLSIIIVSYNTREDTRQCLQSIVEQSPGLDCEIIVVDNDSKDDTRQMIRDEFPQVELIHNRDNVGFARANNQGLERARGQYVLYLNPDTIILDRAILRMLAVMDARAEVGVLGPHTFNADRVTTQNTAMNEPTLAAVFHAQLPFWRLIPFYAPPTLREFAPAETRIVDGVKGCCMLVRSELARAIGGMNEEYFMYAEEYDLCEAARKRGYTVLYLREANIVHLGGASTVQHADAMAAERLRSVKLYFQRKYPGSALQSMRLWFILGSVWRSAVWLIAKLLRKGEPAVVQARLRDHRAMLRWLIHEYEKV